MSLSLEMKETPHSIDDTVGTFLVIMDWVPLPCELSNHTGPEPVSSQGLQRLPDNFQNISCTRQDQIQCTGLHLAGTKTAFKIPSSFLTV